MDFDTDNEVALDQSAMATLLEPLLSSEPSDRAACLAALRRLEQDLIVLPRATDAEVAASTTPAGVRRRLLLRMTMGGGDDTSIGDDSGTEDNDATNTNASTGSNNNGLGRILLGLVGNSSVAEICREKAMLLLKALLLKLVESDEGDDDGDGQQIWSSRHVVQFYVDYCDTTCRRIASSELQAEESEREPSEAIRMELLLALSPLFTLLPNTFNDDDDGGNDHAMVEEASSKLCVAMTQGCCPALLDPYTAIHRESCHFLMQLAVKIPSVVARHSSELLAKLVGGTVEDPNTSTAAGTFVGLMSHRQAKTRCVAIDAVAAILCCCDAGPRNSSSDGTCAPRIEMLLESAHVLSRWEEGPAFDRSAQVRLSLQRSLGKVCRVIFLVDDDDGGDDQTEIHGSTSTSTTCNDRSYTSSPIGHRLISLLLVGLSDDVECVREVASEEMRSLRGGRVDDGFPDDLLPKYANVVLSNLLKDATKASLDADKRVRILHAATRLLQELIEADDINSAFVGGDCDDTATAMAKEAAAVSSSLSLCFGGDCTKLFEAASICARVLGTDATSSAPLIRSALDTLRGGSTTEVSHCHHPLSDCGISSSLFLLESLLRGHCEAARANDGQLPLLEIGGVLHSELVLDAIFTTKAESTPRSLLGACDAFSDVIQMTVASGREFSAASSMIEEIIIATMFILSATDEADANALYSSEPYRNAIDLLLDKAAALCGVGHSRSDLMRRHFRGVLSALQPIDGTSGGQHTSRHLGAVAALIRSSQGSIVAETYDVVGPTLEAYASKEESKFSTLVLLESIASDEAFSQTMGSSNVLAIIENVLLPNLVWSVGGLSAALRKISLATLFSLLKGCSINETTLTTIALRIFPALKSHLSDDDASTKELACCCITSIVNDIDDLPTTLGRKGVSCLCADVSKLLEDESNSVRVAACGALGSFLSNVRCKKEVRGDISMHFIIGQLNKHANDPCSLIREAVSKALYSA